MNACYGVNSLADFNGPSNQFQNLFTVLGHYDWQISQANHFSARIYGTRNHTSGFTGGLGQNETPIAFGGTENFVNQGVSGAFAVNTVLGRKVNEFRVNLARETRNRNPNGPGEQTNLIGPAIIGQRYYLPITGTNSKVQVGDSFAYSFGKHDIKFGGDVDAFRDSNDRFLGWTAGQYNFGTFAAISTTSMASGAVGFPFRLGSSRTLDSTMYRYQAGLLKPAWQSRYRFVFAGQMADHAALYFDLRLSMGRNEEPAAADTFPWDGDLLGTGPSSRPYQFRKTCRMIGSNGGLVLALHGMSDRLNLRQ